MQKLSFAIGAACLSLWTLSVRADTVELNNGSVVRGCIKELKEGKLQVDTGYGKLSIPVNDIAGLVSDNPLWIRIKGEQDYTHSTLSVTGGDILLTDDSGSTQQINKAADITTISVNDPDKDRWRYSGNANAYFNMSRGNDYKDSINVDGRVAARNRLNRHSLDFKTEKEDGEQETTKDHWLFKYNYNRFISPSWYVLGSASWERNRMQSLDSRSTIGAGVGHQFWDEPDLNLKIELGVSQIWEKFTNPDKKRDNQALHWALNYDQKFWDEVTFFHDDDIYRRISTNSWLIQTATGLRYKLTDLLHLSLRYEFDYDDAPQPGRKDNDSSLLFGLGASW